MNIEETRIKDAVSGNIERAIDGLENEDVDIIYLLLKIAEDYGSIEAGSFAGSLLETNQLDIEDTISVNQELCEMYLFGKGVKRDLEKAEPYFEDLEEHSIKLIRKKLSGNYLEKFNEYFPLNPTSHTITNYKETVFNELIVTQNRIVVMNINPKENVRDNIKVGVPCFAIILHYDIPLWQNSAKMATILENYINFIPDNTLNVAFKKSGGYKKFTQAVFNKGQNDLRETIPNEKYCFHNMYYGSIEKPTDIAGQFFAELDARINDDPDETEFWFTKKKTNQLKLGFSIDFVNNIGFSNFVKFYKSVLTICEVNSSYVGYYMHRGFSLRGISWAHINLHSLNNKFNYFMGDGRGNSVYSRNMVCEIGWINYYGKTITQALGGINKIKDLLPEEISVEPFMDGILIKTTSEPLYGRQNSDKADNYSILAQHVFSLVPEEISDDWKERFSC